MKERKPYTSLYEMSHSKERYHHLLSIHMVNLVKHFIKLKLTTSIGNDIYEKLTLYTFSYREYWVKEIRFSFLNDSSIKGGSKEKIYLDVLENIPSEIDSIFEEAFTSALSEYKQLKIAKMALTDYWLENDISHSAWVNDILNFFQNICPLKNEVISKEDAGECVEDFIDQFLKDVK